MKKFLLIILFMVLSNCAGYQPVFNNKNLDFKITDIKTDENKISREIAKRLLLISNDEKLNSIQLELNSTENERIISRDTKGDPLIFEVFVQLEMNLTNGTGQQKYSYQENFLIKNDTNKFELKKYKENIKDNFTNKIFERIIFDLRQQK
jgi:hypothetical protein